MNEVTLDLNEIEIPGAVKDDELLAVDEALAAFAERDSRKAELVKLRYFVGLNIEETAGVLGSRPPPPTDGGPMPAPGSIGAWGATPETTHWEFLSEAGTACRASRPIPSWQDRPCLSGNSSWQMLWNPHLSARSSAPS